MKFCKFFQGSRKGEPSLASVDVVAASTGQSTLPWQWKSACQVAFGVVDSTDRPDTAH